MLLPQIINEIKNLKAQPNHRSSLVIFQLLENNKAQFLQNMEADNFNHVHTTFEQLSNSTPREHSAPGYNSDFERAHSLLMFYLDRIL